MRLNDIELDQRRHYLPVIVMLVQSAKSCGEVESGVTNALRTISEPAVPKSLLQSILAALLSGGVSVAVELGYATKHAADNSCTLYY